MSSTHYIAMWSGPRNISTAMLRAWENRPDTIVVDEPLYAHYLLKTGIEHPGAEEIIAYYETDWRAVVKQITAPLPDGKTIYYQKHMNHHLLHDMDWEWVLKLSNAFLIREPARVIVSMAKVLPSLEISQTGFPQQIALFNYLRERTGATPPVIDTQDVLMNPRAILSQLCDQLGVPFMESMLRWPAGKRDTDGIWAKYWYASVEQSTGFMPYEPTASSVPDHLTNLLDECNAIYAQLRSYRIQA